MKLIRLITKEDIDGPAAVLMTDAGRQIYVKDTDTGVLITIYNDDTPGATLRDQFFSSNIRQEVRWFISSPDEFVCQDCVTPADEAKIEADTVSVWEEGSEGWTAPVHCDRCGRDLQVDVLPEDGG